MPPTDVHITVLLSGHQPQDITLSYPLDPEHEALLRALHEEGGIKGRLECRMHDDDPALRDLRSADERVHEAWLYLRTRPGTTQLTLCHWPNGIVTGSHAVPSTMTPEHRRRQEYIALRGADAGYDVELEKSYARGTRSDVVVQGAHTLAAEVQQSGITVAAVLRRTGKATAAGATVTWFADEQPSWAFRVPTAVTNDRLGMDPGMWTVATGPRLLDSEKCGPSSRRPCPAGRNWCGRWHRFWEPMPGITVDHIVEMVPGGGLVRLDTGTKQGTVLTTPANRDAWLDEHPPEPGQIVIPNQRVHDGITHNPYSAKSLRSRIEREQAALLASSTVEPPLHRPRPCPSCGRESRAIVDGRCLACRLGVA